MNRVLCINTLLYFVVSIVTPNAFADRVGNGGDAVVCRDENGSINMAEMLDHYEARTQLGIIIGASHDHTYDWVQSPRLKTTC